MSTIIEQGVVGIVTGILTTVLIFMARNFWETKFVPFLEKTRYQGVLLSGQWYGTSQNDDPEKGDIYWNEATLFLDQKAHDLNGIFIFKFRNPEKDFSLEFDVDGYVWEGYLTLNFTPNDQEHISKVIQVLKTHRVKRIVTEATGRYEHAFVFACDTADLPAVVVNPKPNSALYAGQWCACQNRDPHKRPWAR